MAILGTSATAFCLVAARAWEFFGCQFELGEDRISKRGAMVKRARDDGRKHGGSGFSTAIDSTLESMIVIVHEQSQLTGPVLPVSSRSGFKVGPISGPAYVVLFCRVSARSPC